MRIPWEKYVTRESGNIDCDLITDEGWDIAIPSKKELDILSSSCFLVVSIIGDKKRLLLFYNAFLVFCYICTL